MLRTPFSLLRPGVGYYFEVSLCRISFCVQPFCLVFFTCFFSFSSGCVFFSKTESFVLVLSFDFFVFYSIVVRLENGLQNVIYPVLIWFWSGLGTAAFSFLVMLLLCSFVTLVNCFDYCSSLYNSF